MKDSAGPASRQCAKYFPIILRFSAWIKFRKGG